MFLLRLLRIIAATLISVGIIHAQNPQKLSISKEDQEKKVLKETKVSAAEKSLDLTIRNVDITSYPQIQLILEAFNIYGEPVDTLRADQLFVLEDGVEKKIISIKKTRTKRPNLY